MRVREKGERERERERERDANESQLTESTILGRRRIDRRGSRFPNGHVPPRDTALGMSTDGF
jgi:hypothetical protein